MNIILSTLVCKSFRVVDVFVLCCQDMSKEEEKRLEEELKGTYESISLDANGQALVERRDVWGGSGSSQSLGLRFG